jgi:hypothetical protein
MKASQWKPWLLAATVVMFFLPTAGRASETDTHTEPWEKFGIQAGYFLSAVDSGVRLGTGLGVDIDVEDLLGLDSSSSVFRVGALWRFTENRRHRLDFSWFSLNRDGTRRVLEDFSFENKDGETIVVNAGTTVDAFFDVDLYQLAYSYSFLQDDRLDLAGLIGVYVAPIDVGLAVSGLVNEQGSADFTAPLPVLGLRMDIALTPRWFIRTGAQAFYLEYKRFTGSILKVNAALEYNPWEHVGIGLGFDTMRINVEAEDEDWPGIDLNGKVNFNYAGLQLYLRFFY